MWHVIRDMWHVISDTWYVVCDVWYVVCDMWYVTCDLRCVTCDSWYVWYVTCAMWHVIRVICDMWFVTCDLMRWCDVVSTWCREVDKKSSCHASTPLPRVVKRNSMHIKINHIALHASMYQYTDAGQCALLYAFDLRIKCQYTMLATLYLNPLAGQLRCGVYGLQSH